MRDVEFVLRYFTFRNSWRDFSGGMRRHMDLFMSENQKPSSPTIEEMRQDFLATLDTVEGCFGENAFRRWIPEREQWRQQILASIYDSQMFACRGISIDDARAYRSKILNTFKQLFDDSEFRRSVDAATNTPSYFKTRIQIVKSMLEEILTQID